MACQTPPRLAHDGLHDHIGLLLLMFGTTVGSEAMKRIAAPMVGGLVTAALFALIVLPVIYGIVHGRKLPKASPDQSPGDSSDGHAEPEAVVT